MEEKKEESILHPGTKEEFTKILKSGKPVLVDFFAVWCGPCQMMGPILEDMSEKYQYADEIIIAKVDIDELHEVAVEYGIMSVPTFMIFDKAGKPVETMVGMRGGAEIEDKLTALVTKK